MMAKRSKGTGFHYRDSRSGRFVPKSTWKRSKAQGGKRYKREKQKSAKREQEYEINVKYKLDDKKAKTEIQIAAHGPSGKKSKEVTDAIEEYRETGEAPEGWTFHVVEWTRPKGKFTGDDTELTWDSIKRIMPFSKVNARVRK